MPVNPEVDISGFLNSKTFGDLTLTEGTNLFRGHPEDDGGVASTAAFVRVAPGGVPPTPYLQGASGPDWWEPVVQVFLRYDGSRTKARNAARDLNQTLHKASITGYTFVLANQSEPDDPVPDARDRLTYVLEFRLGYKE